MSNDTPKYITKEVDGGNFRLGFEFGWNKFAIPTTFDPERKIHTLKITDEALDDIILQANKFINEFVDELDDDISKTSTGSTSDGTPRQ